MLRPINVREGHRLADNLPHYSIEILLERFEASNEINHLSTRRVCQIVQLVSVDPFAPISVDDFVIAIFKELLECCGPLKDEALEFVEKLSARKGRSMSIDHRPPGHQPVPRISHECELEIGVPDIGAVKFAKITGEKMLLGTIWILAQSGADGIAASLLNMNKDQAPSMNDHGCMLCARREVGQN